MADKEALQRVRSKRKLQASNSKLQESLKPQASSPSYGGTVEAWNLELSWGLKFGV
jgi:hypothetical protein